MACKAGPAGEWRVRWGGCAVQSDCLLSYGGGGGGNPGGGRDVLQGGGLICGEAGGWLKRSSLLIFVSGDGLGILSFLSMFLRLLPRCGT